MTKEEVANKIIDMAKDGIERPFNDYCVSTKLCKCCPFYNDDCAEAMIGELINRLVKAEERQETNLEHWYDSFDRTTLCTYIRLREEACRFYKDSDADTMLDWLLSPYEEPPKCKLSKLEYDLLDFCKQYNDTQVIKDWAVLMEMQNKGHYKDIPTDVTIGDILENAEVIDEWQS